MLLKVLTFVQLGQVRKKWTPSIHYTKMWHRWLEHIQVLVSQSNHVVIYSLQQCHFYDYSHFHDYKTSSMTIVIFLKLLCMPLTLLYQIFKIKTPWWGAHIFKWKTLVHIQKHIVLILYIVIWMQLVLQCIILI
jgi:hypothetical protein